MKTIALIIMVAIVLEALVEYAKTIMHMVEEQEYKTAITQGITILLGIGLAFAFRLELFNGALSEFYENLTLNGTIDMILTGILFSRGSNYFSDLISKLTRKAEISEGQLLAMAEDGLDYVVDYEDIYDIDEEDGEEEGEENGIADGSEA